MPIITHTVHLNSTVYTVVDDVTTTYWAVITGLATDDVFGTLDAPGLNVELSRTDLAAKAFSNGLYAISGYPSQSLPQLATTSYSVNYTLTAPGYRDFPLTAIIPINATFPVQAPPAALRRLPVRVQGRVVNGATKAPIGGATVASIDDPSSPPTIHVTALRSPLYFAHPTGATAQNVSVTTFGSAVLTQNAAAGTGILMLSTRVGLAAGTIIRLSYNGSVQLEYGVVDHLAPGGTGAGQVFLCNLLNRSYPVVGTAVDFVNTAPSGGAASLTVDANAGDGVLLASQLFSQTVAIEPGSAAEEVHEVGALTGSDGYYGLDGIGRVQQIFLQATQGASKQTADWFVEYDQEPNIVDFQL